MQTKHLDTNNFVQFTQISRMEGDAKYDFKKIRKGLQLVLNVEEG